MFTLLPFIVLSLCISTTSVTAHDGHSEVGQIPLDTSSTHTKPSTPETIQVGSVFGVTYFKLADIDIYLPMKSLQTLYFLA